MLIGEYLFFPHGPLRMPEDETGADLLVDREEVGLAAEPAMIAALGLFQPRQVRVQLVLGWPGRAIDALQHRPLLIATPVGAGDGEEFERADLGGAGHMGAAAQIEELALLVGRDDLVVR